MSSLNGRMRYQAVYSGEPFDRLPIRGVGRWGETDIKWRSEGLPEGEDPNDVIGLSSDEALSLPVNLNMVPLFDIRVLREDERHVTLVDEYGVTKRMLKSDFDRSKGKKGAAGDTSSMSQWLDFPVKNLDGWKAIFEERFRPNLIERVPESWKTDRSSFQERSETRWVNHFCFPYGGLFSGVRELMGLEGLVFAIADDPGLVRTIVSDLSSFYLDVFSQILRDVRLDQITCFEDMCSNRAPLVSPEMFREFFMPSYKKYIGGLIELGVQQVFIDTDGDSRLIIPELMECGFTGVHPCEIKAGMDPAPLLEQYPTLCLNGGIDKVAVAKGGSALDSEFQTRFAVAWKYGRYTPGLDHAAPPDISWKNIQQYSRLFLSYCKSPGIAGANASSVSSEVPYS